MSQAEQVHQLRNERQGHRLLSKDTLPRPRESFLLERQIEMTGGAWWGPGRWHSLAWCVCVAQAGQSLCMGYRKGIGKGGVSVSLGKTSH